MKQIGKRMLQTFQMLAPVEVVEKEKNMETIEIREWREVDVEEIPDTDFAYFFEKWDGKIDNSGVTSIENIIATMEYKTFVSEDISLPNGNPARVLAVKKADLQAVMADKKYGFEDIQNIWKKCKFLYQIPLPILDDYQLLLYDLQDHLVADIFGNYISVPILFSDWYGEVSSMDYNLKKLLTKLKSDSRILDRENLRISIPNRVGDDSDLDCTPFQIKFCCLLPPEEYADVMKNHACSASSARSYILDELLGAKDCKEDEEDDDDWYLEQDWYLDEDEDLD